MNRFYRVVFNRSLGVWQAVPETAKAQGKGGKPAKAVIVALLALGAVQTAVADDITWSGGPDNYWHAGSNWVGGMAPVAGDNVLISAPLNHLIINTDGAVLSNPLFMGQTGGGPVDVRLSVGTGKRATLDGLLTIDDGSTLRLGSAGHEGTLTLSGHSGVFPSAKLTLSVEHGTFRPGSYEIKNLTSQRGSTLNVGADGIYDLNGDASYDLVRTARLTGSGHIRNDGTADANLIVGEISTFDGVIEDGGKKTRLTSFGNLTLTGDNTYTGGTHITNHSTLQVGDGGTTGVITGDVVNAGAGTLAFNRSNDYVFDGNISEDGGHVGIDFVKNFGSGTLTLSGVISGHNTFVQEGTGKTILTGANTYDGGTTVTRGTLVAGSPTALGTGMIELQRNDVELVLDADGAVLNNPLSIGETDGGPVDVTLSVGTGKSVKLNGGLTITRGGTRTLRIGSAGHDGTLTLSGHSGPFPSANLKLSVEHGTFRPGDFFAAELTNGSGSILNVGADGIYDLNGMQAMTQMLTGSGHIRNDGAADASLTVNQNSTFDGVIEDGGKKTRLDVLASHLTLTGDNTYTGGTTITGGAGSRLQVGNGGTTGAIAGDVENIGIGTLAFNRSDDYSFGGNISTRGGVLDHDFVRNAGSGTLTLAGDISGTNTLVQEGTGKTILTGANTYIGGTKVTGGTLQFGNGTDGGANELGGEVHVINGSTLAIRTPATVNVLSGVALESGTTMAITAGGSDPALRADSLRIAPSVAFNLDGISDLNGTERVLIDTVTGISGDFANVSIGGAAGAVDYMALKTRKSDDSKQYLASRALSWVAGNNLAHGTFTLTNPNEQFTVGTALSDQAANPVIGWDGGSLTKAGAGTLILSGANTYTGGTRVTGGTLQVDGSLANSDVAVQSGATLIANGTVGGSVDVQAAGRVLGTGTLGDMMLSGTAAPGNGAMGTLNVAGNIAFNPGSVYEVKADASGASDRIQAGGTTTLNGSTVQVLAGAGQYAPSTSYTILTAQGGRNGTFDNVSSNLAFLTPTLDYDANNVHLTMTRNDLGFADMGQTPNQMAVGRKVERLGLNNAIYDATLNLSADQVRPAFDALSGEIHASVRTALLEDSRFVRNAANDSLRAAQTASGRPGAGLTAPVAGAGPVFWVQGLGSWGSSNSDGNAARLSRDSHGLLLGVDGNVGDWRVGVLTGYGDTSAKTSERNASASSRNVHLGVYGGTQWGGLALRTGTAYSWHSMKTHRNVTMPGFADSLKDKYRAGTWQTFAELGYGMAAAENTRIEPFVNLAHVRLRTNGYTEQGGAAALNGDSADTNLTFTTLGLRAEHQATVGSTEIVLSGLLGWRRAFGDTTPTATHGFQGAGSAFTVAGAPIAKNSALIEAGVSVKLSPVANLGLSYTGQLASSARDHGVRANLTVRF